VMNLFHVAEKSSKLPQLSRYTIGDLAVPL